MGSKNLYHIKLFREQQRDSLWPAPFVWLHSGEVKEIAPGYLITAGFTEKNGSDLRLVFSDKFVGGIESNMNLQQCRFFQTSCFDFEVVAALRNYAGEVDAFCVMFQQTHTLKEAQPCKPIVCH